MWAADRNLNSVVVWGKQAGNASAAKCDINICQLFHVSMYIPKGHGYVCPHKDLHPIFAAVAFLAVIKQNYSDFHPLVSGQIKHWLQEFSYTKFP